MVTTTGIETKPFFKKQGRMHINSFLEDLKYALPYLQFFDDYNLSLNGQIISTLMSFQNRIDGPTHNVIDVWKRNFTGEGVVVAVVDEGFDPEHPEIKANYIQVSHVHSNNL